jgi:hypothetical protein
MSLSVYIRHDGQVIRGYAAVLLKMARIETISSRISSVSPVADLSDLLRAHARHIVSLEQRERAAAAEMVSLPVFF